MMYLISFLLSIHVFYVGTMDIKFSESSTFQSTIKLDIDNFEFALEEVFTVDLNIYGDEEHVESVDSLIQQYLRRGLTIEVNGEIKPFTFIGREFEGDGFIYLYIETEPFLEEITSIKVNNALLMDVFKQQTNLIKLDYKGKKKAELAKKGRSIVILH